LFIFSANIGLRRQLSQDRSHRRISEKIESDTVELSPLSQEKVHEVIDRRVSAYALSNEPKPPVPERAIDILYESSDGEIRYVLNRASGIATKVAHKLPSQNPIDEDLALAALQQIVRDKIESLELTDRKWEILERITDFEKVQPKNYDDFDLKSSQSFSNYLREFYDMRLVERSREGRESIYTPRGDVQLYFRQFNEVE
jgi:DNA-binding transcriptional ArsR family regulator